MALARSRRAVFGSLAMAALTLTFCYLLFLRPDSARAAIFVVNDNGDSSDLVPGDGGCLAVVVPPTCTLRAAIEESNALAGADIINFAIPGVGPHTITPGSALPTITDAVTIDGYSQPGASANTNPISSGSNAVLMIELDGTGAGPANGLMITAGNSTVNGLVINRFDYGGVEIFAGSGNLVEGNFIGTNVTGTVDLGNTNWGVLINGAANNTIGGTAAGSRNVISGNNNHGIEIGYSIAVTGNLVQGNYIGTDATGIADLGNSGNGVFVNGAPNNTIGGTAAGSRNVISGNNNHGIGIGFGSAVTGNLVQGNYIGTDATGISDLGNSVAGVFINGAPGNTIGGTTVGARNVISGNNSHGIEIGFSSTVTGNLVQGNYIGTDATGIADLGNSGNGVFINGAPNNTIGGTAAGSRNVISGNNNHGIGIGFSSAVTGNLVQGNYIGTDVTGSASLGNSADGVHISGASGNTIGGTAAGARNVVSGNSASGVLISGGSATGNMVQGNFIGTDVTGSVDLGNTAWGVLILGPSNNTIGGTAAGARNIISGNNTLGVEICCSGATGNLVQGNFIGTDVTGALDLGNTSWGVLINDAPNNTIGGATAGARNIISGNGSLGIEITAGGATGNLVQGNFIGTDVTGTLDVGNTTDGVFVNGSPSNTIGGTVVGAGNVISGNNGRGLSISGAVASTGNMVQGNYIGTDLTGTLDLGNSGDGVAIFGASNTVGGTAAGGRNVISGNSSSGVHIEGVPATGNVVQGNFIGTDVTGSAGLGNTAWGVLINGAPNNTIGGTAAAARNIISGNGSLGIGICCSGATGNLVQGNYIGTDATGTLDVGNTIGGVSINGADSNTVGGTVAGAGNVISGNDGRGLSITAVVGATGNLVQGNYIGTDATGSAGLGNSADGVHISGGCCMGPVTGNTIGGTSAGARNVISGNGASGVLISAASATGNLVQGNYIGTDATGSAALGNSGNGVYVAGAPSNTIGGSAGGAANTIAHNGGDGVFVDTGAGNLVSRNSINSNTGLGIDLAPDAVTSNDAGDPDTGANDLQNYPVLTSAASGGGSTTIAGSLNSTPNASFDLDFFSSPVCDPSTFGEGLTYIGSSTQTTDGSGNVAFSLTVGTALPVGDQVTATAASGGSSTSEFSKCVIVQQQAAPTPSPGNPPPNPVGGIIGLRADGDVKASVGPADQGSTSGHAVAFSLAVAATLTVVGVTILSARRPR